jgi:hypothetical protein
LGFGAKVVSIGSKLGGSENIGEKCWMMPMKCCENFDMEKQPEVDIFRISLVIEMVKIKFLGRFLRIFLGNRSETHR